ncbi:tryptophan--tRNA ligase [Candidatus Falkowbacteria bacterium CG10_big_fil_rev_8_21_14_0_10_44_15]|uniref:Tryptophan--tRNA ligase n=1 Tax=Candidatus Falkowbacteria bacterium CG10_big_fil_rev_8_21_14_0_10_44_15 TaxID=1974569 RepID=A0A2H0UZY6_9BACT|nr:MAG: tryptophan--tRNA ligase [Candidatus Falkowbacteria bacterium CG10_big_fil_rev_8_21_14_0_10_44_15]
MNKTIFSGVQPSGNLHLGNYLGALKNWVALQNQYRCIFCVVDYHAITLKQDPKVLRSKILEIAKLYLAAGINPETAIIFQQSQVSAHTELAWILNTITKTAELQRMTQFKDKAKENKENINMGLFDYPVLMAADILLYNTDLVPVGDDQSQHVELTRVLARRFNSRFKDVFKLPEVYIQKQGARVMGLDDPRKKMSKSASSEFNYVALLDKPAMARKKIMKAVTDSGSEIKFDLRKKPALANLLAIYSLLANVSVQELEARYNGHGYGELKKDLAEVVAKFLAEFQHRFSGFDDQFINNILEQGRQKASAIAAETLTKVKEAIGVA